GITVAGGTADKSMALSRVASAFGVALALGEIREDQLDESTFLEDFSLYSSVASCSSGIEVSCNEIVLLGNSRQWAGDCHISHRPMADALDIGALYGLLNDLNIDPATLTTSPGQSPIAAAFVKCEADRRGLIRGQPHTMLNDGDMNQQRHIRGAVGGIAAAVLADTRIFVSGGAEHQGPDGGGIVTAIARKPESSA
ncbi:ring-opening amidohydrolase, partial [uncultured Marinobacter sp.]|uniref:ring-opening amidohydrolase n=1 Tax=uncultured Marinobacter sp. TaxID=187379 RepID=UPI0030D73C55